MRHVRLTCRHHPTLRWSCKSIATSPRGGYNGARNIFFLGIKTDEGYTGLGRECDCKPSALILAPEETWDAECES